MRENKFRGIEKETGQFVYGGIAQEVLTASGFIADVAIMPPRCYGIEVLPETVGQYTGLKDREGTDIYEGDLLQNPYSQTCHYVIEWCQSDHGSGWKKTRKNSKTDLGAECETMKVIGNIHQTDEKYHGY